MHQRNWKLLSLLLLAACLTATAVFAGNQDDDEVVVEKEVKVIVKKHVDCEGEADCEKERRMIFIGEDGEHHEVEGDHVWVAHGGGHHGHHAMSGGFLGIQMTELTPELRAHFGVPEDAGVMVSKVVDDSPAARAGIQVGDVVSAVDGDAVASGSALASAIRRHEDGAAVNLEIWRGGQVQTLTATLEEREGHRKMRTFRAHPGHDHATAGHDCGGEGHDHAMAGHDCGGEGHDHAMAGHDCGGEGHDHAMAGHDCGGEGPCEVHVECDGDDCTCTVNGEAADCDEVHGHHGGE